MCGSTGFRFSRVPSIEEEVDMRVVTGDVYIGAVDMPCRPMVGDILALDTDGNDSWIVDVVTLYLNDRSSFGIVAVCERIDLHGGPSDAP